MSEKKYLNRISFKEIFAQLWIHPKSLLYFFLQLQILFNVFVP